MTRLILAATGCVIAAASSAQTNASFASPNFDRWNYPFNFTPGERTAASTFSSSVTTLHRPMALEKVNLAGEYPQWVASLRALIDGHVAAAERGRAAWLAADVADDEDVGEGDE